MALLDDSTILLAVGDYCSVSSGAKKDDLSFDYGKVLKVRLSDWSTSVFSKGNRNTQGLWVEPGETWQTEHGPQGGDELNVLVEGEDYGWPVESYGTGYGKKTFKEGRTGGHSTTRRPIYAWIPSIGISNLIRIGDKGFPSWGGDLMIGSLNGKGHGFSLLRVRVREQRVVTVEQFVMGKRVRDLLELPDGRIAIWNGTGTIQIVESASHAFSTCEGCHRLDSKSHGIGPSLKGLVGSKVASHDDFEYSSAMKSFGGRWSPDRLDAFIADPAGTIPGTAMAFEGIKDPHVRKQLIEYLKSPPSKGKNKE